MRFTDPDFVDHLRALGVPVAEKLGHGAWGIAYAHATKLDRVIKVTVMEGEARAARYIASRTVFGVAPHVCLPAISDFHDLKGLRLTGYRGDGRAWAFEREILGDWWPAGAGVAWGYAPEGTPAGVSEGFHAAINSLTDALYVSTLRDPIERMRYIDSYDDTVVAVVARMRVIMLARAARVLANDPAVVLAAFDQTLKDLGVIYRDMRDFAEWCKDHRIELRDLGRENWGVRSDGRVVVRDLGGVRIPP